MINFTVSSETIAEAKRVLEDDQEAREIDSVENKLKALKLETARLEATSHHLKTERTNLYKKFRMPVINCVKIDANNNHYFLKNAVGVYNCVAFIAKIELTTEIRQKITITLSSLFKEKKIGRTLYKEVFYYGVTDFFEQDEKGLYTILKQERKKMLTLLKN